MTRDERNEKIEEIKAHYESLSITENYKFLDETDPYRQWFIDEIDRRMPAHLKANHDLLEKTMWDDFDDYVFTEEDKEIESHYKKYCDEVQKEYEEKYGEEISRLHKNLQEKEEQLNKECDEKVFKVWEEYYYSEKKQEEINHIEDILFKVSSELQIDDWGNFVFIIDNFPLGKRVLVTVTDFGSIWADKVSDAGVKRNYPVYESLMWLVGKE